MTSEDPKEPNVWGVLLVGAVGGAVLLGSYLHLRHGFALAQLKDHANLGNAIAPMVTFLTLLAVVAALWSVQVQRAELALQRQELRETREEMVEQRLQFERTGRAQEALAGSQSELAAEQKIANRLTGNANRRAASLEQAQRTHTIAVLLSVCPEIRSEAQLRACIEKGEAE